MADAAACLEALAREPGSALTGDVRLLEARLRAEAGADGADVDLLLAAADAGVPEALQAEGADDAAIATQLAEARMIDPADALRAVAAWAGALRQRTVTAASATPGRSQRRSITAHLRRPIVLLPVTVAALSLLAAAVLPSPSADPIPAPAGGGGGGGRPTTSTAGPTTSAAGPGTVTEEPGTGGVDPGPGDQPADPEAELRAMFPALSSGCTRKTENAFGVVHLECSTAQVNTWLIRFESPDTAATFFTGGVNELQTTAVPWQDASSGAGGFSARTDSGDRLYWSYTGPDSATTVVVEAAAQPGADLTDWWVSVRTPVVSGT